MDEGKGGNHGVIRAMIADDESATRNGLLRHIRWKELGVDWVRAAANGAELLAMCDGGVPDIVISDVRMPGMSGMELCRILHERYPQCRIIFLSGSSDKQYLMEAIELSAVSYVEKPVVPEQLERVILRAVEECRRLRGSAGDVEEASLSARLDDALFSGDGGRAFELAEEARQLLRKHEKEPARLRGIAFALTYRIVLRLTPDDEGMSLARELRETLEQMRTPDEMAEYLLSRLDALYPAQGDPYSAAVRKTSALIERDLSKPSLSLSSLAAEVYLTPTYLSSLFKKNTGKTVGAYIVERRISRARTLLGDGGVKLYSVAREVGYTDQNYFARLFKRETGMTPSDYKEKRL